MKSHWFWIGLATAVLAGAAGSANAAAEIGRTPVLVELFTSEGCSSCPAADVLLEKLDNMQPLPEAQVIVLSEHVDYWNHIGWKDPFSSAAFSNRQANYARRFGLEGPYTPQMIVNGTTEFVGSDARKAVSAIGAASKLEKVSVRILPIKTGPGVRIEVDPLPGSAGRGEANVYLVLAENSATSNVLRGENKGRTLQHVAIVRKMQQVGSVNHKAGFGKDVSIGRTETAAMRLIAFVQEPDNGRVWGAAMAK